MDKIYIPHSSSTCPSEVTVEDSDFEDEDESDDASGGEIYVFYQGDLQTGDVYKVQLPEELCISLKKFKTDLDDQNEEPFTEISLRCSHILVKHVDSDVPSSWRNPEITMTKKDARRTIKRLHRLIRNGELYFDETARWMSDCCSAQNDGDLNIFRLGQTFPKFEKVLLSLKINHMSRVFETRAGFHIVRRTSLELQRTGTQRRRRIMLTVNDKVRARKHMAKKHVRFTLSRNSDREYFKRFKRTIRMLKMHPTSIETISDEEERNFNLKMYEEQQRLIEECLLSNTPIDDDESITELTFEESEDSKYSVILTVPKIEQPPDLSKNLDCIWQRRNPLAFTPRDQEKWQPPDLYKNVDCKWKSSDPFTFTPTDTEEWEQSVFPKNVDCIWKSSDLLTFTPTDPETKDS